MSSNADAGGGGAARARGGDRAGLASYRGGTGPAWARGDADLAYEVLDRAKANVEFSAVQARALVADAAQALKDAKAAAEAAEQRAAGVEAVAEAEAAAAGGGEG